MLSERRKIVILILLLVPCIWLVRQNIFQGSSSAAPPTGSGPSRTQTLTAAAAGSPLALEDYDPSLRLDLLEASRSVEYQGYSRNIFEFYTPPAPPPLPAPDPAPPLPPTDPMTGAALVPPRPPAINLKFYGTAQRQGGPRRAFLTDGEEITIAQEGETVADHYRIIRIGVSTMELEDTRSNQKQELFLIEE